MKVTKFMYFLLDGCDISFTAKAPEDITLKELLKQTDKIKPDWCACGIRSLKQDEIENLVKDNGVEIIIGYDSIVLNNEYAPCKIVD